MKDSSAPNEALRRTLLVGGVLLIASAVLAFATPSLLSMPGVLRTGVFWTATLAFSAALIVYGVGLGRTGSIVARRPLGVGAMVLLAVWPLVDSAVSLPLAQAVGPTEFSLAWGWASIAVRLGASIVIVVQIARAGVIRGRMRWAPLWALVAVAVPQLLAQLLIVASGVAVGGNENDGIWLLFGLGQLTAFAAPVGLGILSIVLASRQAARAASEAVQVYPPE